MQDPYETLGIARDASQDDVRRAYRALAKKHHPDLNPGNNAALEQFKVVSAANEILSDPKRRGRFDRGEIDAENHERPQRPTYRDYAEGDAGHHYGQAGTQPEGWTAAEFDDMFGTVFAEHGRQARQGPRHGRDEHYTLAAAFLDAVNGTTQRLTLPDGRTLDVKIPAATNDGAVLRLRGQGGPGRNGGSAGDALIEIQVLPHPYFVRDGRDIRLDLPVSLSEAVLGGFIEVPTPRGPVRMRIPARSDSGTELRLRGRGVPEQGPHPAGDLFATLRVSIGTTDQALEDFLRDWKPETAANPRMGMETVQ